MRTCEKCGFDGNRDTAQFCAECGEALSVQALLSVGSVLHERYRVVRVLGKGGMGAVYLVEDTKLYGKLWAVKELLERFVDANDRAESVAQFQQEAKLLVGLRHPNLPQIVDAFEQEGRHYLVMEFVEGLTLEAMLEQSPEGAFTEEQVLEWAGQICDVLNYLHAHDPPVIFRDLKPANIMITPEGRVKLIDFGVARLFDPSKGTDTLKMGTVGYAPPEQYAGQGQTTPRSDVYALGATLYELLTGDNPEAHPFVFTPVRAVNRRVSTQTSLTIDKAVQLDPNDRFPSALAMKVALRGKKKARWPLIAALVGGPLLLVGIAVGVYFAFFRGGPEEEIVPTVPVVAVVETDTPMPSATPTQIPTSTPLPTLTPTATPLPTETQTPTPTPTLTPTLTPSPIPTARPTLNVTAGPTSQPTSPPGPVLGAGTILYTIQTDMGYYLAKTSSTATKGELLGPTTYDNSTCSSSGVAKTLEGDSFNLYWGYRCGVAKLVECASPDGQYKIILWREEKQWTLSVRQVSDGSTVGASYAGEDLSNELQLTWSPDSRYFYFGLKREMHRGSPLEAGYQAIASDVYQPSLSPDGSMLMYLKPTGGAGGYDLMVINATGPRGEPVNVTNAPEIEKLCPRWAR
ncbi:MAG: protein kinase [Anaerolineae bacterium]|nr:protein kinase [Anaerolineae bacterium]